MDKKKSPKWKKLFMQQTDTWLTEETSGPERCPLCSKPLNGSTACYSCGFSMKPPDGSSVWIDPAVYGSPLSSSGRRPSLSNEQDSTSLQPKKQPNPMTPIPPRASARPANAAPGSAIIPKRSGTNQKDSVPGKGKQPEEASAPVGAQKGSPVWQYESPNFQAASSLPSLSLLLSETPTKPELSSSVKAPDQLSNIDEIDTVPPLDEAQFVVPSRALVPVASQSDVAAFNGPSGMATLAPKEGELFSWTAGEASRSSYAQLISNRRKRKKSHSGISFNLLDHVRWWLLRPGHIEFVLWLGGTMLLVGVTCVLLLVTAFSFDWLTPGSAGTASTNIATTATRSQQSTPVTKAARTSNKATGAITSTPVPSGGKGVSTTPVPTTSPGVAPTATPVTSGGPGPAGGTPVTSTPTPAPTVTTTPTVTPTPQTTPTVTPTPQTTPTVTPTAGSSPAPTSTPAGTSVAGSTPTASSSAVAGSSLGSALNHSGEPLLATRLASLNPWIWVMVACYSFSMLLLGLAGVMHRRHR